jgi:multiple sugar transport system permease protein
MITDPVFIGFKNFTKLFSDTRFLKSLQNIFYYVFGLVTINSIFGLILAIVFHGQGRVNQVLRTAFFLPAVSGSIATGIIWFAIFTGEDYGLGNVFRSWLGLPTISWLTTSYMAIPILILFGIWGGVGYAMIFFLAGLRGIPEEYTEAASIDGASALQRLWYITIPLLRPITLYVIITGIISAFQLFDASYVLFRNVENVGGPLDMALTPVLYLYDRAFSRFKMGYASSIAWVLFVIIIILSLINLRIGRGNETA